MLWPETVCSSAPVCVCVYVWVSCRFFCVRVQKMKKKEEEQEEEEHKLQWSLWRHLLIILPFERAANFYGKQVLYYYLFTVIKMARRIQFICTTDAHIWLERT